MTQALIMRDRSVVASEAEKSTALMVLTRGVRGIDDKNHKRWTRFLSRLLRLEDGEIAEIGTRVPRSGAFHRFHMLVESTVFKSQERFTEFEMFRDWMKIGSGFVVWVPGAKGGIVPLPKSESYADLEEVAAREQHDNMMAFLRGPHAAPYLWRHLPPAKAAEMMASVLLEFDK